MAWMAVVVVPAAAVATLRAVARALAWAFEHSSESSQEQLGVVQENPTKQADLESLRLQPAPELPQQPQLQKPPWMHLPNYLLLLDSQSLAAVVPRTLRGVAR